MESNGIKTMTYEYEQFTQRIRWIDIYINIQIGVVVSVVVAFILYALYHELSGWELVAQIWPVPVLLAALVISNFFLNGIQAVFFLAAQKAVTSERPQVRSGNSATN